MGSFEVVVAQFNSLKLKSIESVVTYAHSHALDKFVKLLLASARKLPHVHTF